MALPTEKAAIKSITSVQVLNEKSYVKVGTNLFAEEVYKDLQLLFPSTLHSKLSVPPTEMCLLNELWFIPPTLHQPLHFCCPSGNQMWSTKTRLCGNKPCLLLWGPEKQLQKLWLSYSEVLVLQRIKTEEETYARMGYTAVKQKSMSSKEVLNHAYFCILMKVIHLCVSEPTLWFFPRKENTSLLQSYSFSDVNSPMTVTFMMSYMHMPLVSSPWKKCEWNFHSKESKEWIYYWWQGFYPYSKIYLLFLSYIKF